MLGSNSKQGQRVGHHQSRLILSSVTRYSASKHRVSEAEAQSLKTAALNDVINNDVALPFLSIRSTGLFNVGARVISNGCGKAETQLVDVSVVQTAWTAGVGRRQYTSRPSPPPTTSIDAMMYIAARVVPVTCVNQPTTIVLKKPAILPNELISATPVAAAAPPTTALGMTQKTGRLLTIAAVPMVRPIMPSNRLSP